MNCLKSEISKKNRKDSKNSIKLTLPLNQNCAKKTKLIKKLIFIEIKSKLKENSKLKSVPNSIILAFEGLTSCFVVSREL